MTADGGQAALASYTTLGLGGPAGRFAAAGTERDLVAEVQAADRRGDPLLVLGGGSNVVIGDDGFPGTVVRVVTAGVRLAAADRASQADGAGGAVTVTAAAGEDWDALARRCAAEGLAGVECLAGIPGLVGATPIQNVGAYGQEVAETITAVRAYDRASREIAELSGADCGFGYRTSMFKRSTGWRAGHQEQPGPAAPTGRYVVLSVIFRLARDRMSGPIRYAELARHLGVAPGERVPLADARAAVLDLRRGKGMVLDPADPDTQSAGSFFTNPVIGPARLAAIEEAARARFGPDAVVPRFPAGDGRVKVPAAWLIERAGFAKGYGGAGARISAKHTLALVNPGGGSTKDLLALASEIQDGVRASFGIKLIPEPVLVGASL
ncbi:MAG TPA: UDP-N-acetylmuramate dehydrogenase [Streptosporangiaceae bacterium]|jgi:UDP-N-acetylmuramate dehydrogenase